MMFSEKKEEKTTKRPYQAPDLDITDVKMNAALLESSEAEIKGDAGSAKDDTSIDWNNPS